MKGKMTSHERLLAALRGQEVDRIPWSPFLAYWWEAQPIAIQERGQAWFYREIGADALLRGFTMPFICSDISGLRQYEMVDELPGCEILRQTRGDTTCIEHKTPVGSLYTITRFSREGNTEFVVDHPVKRRADYAILRYLVERMVIRPCFDPIRDAIRDLGEDGLYVPLVSPFLKTPFQSLIEHFTGTQNLVYHLVDFPEEVDATLEVMSCRAMEAVTIAAESPAEAFITWEDSSTTNVSPAMFARYILPDLNRWGRVIHDAGKLLLHHACGKVRALLPLMADEEVDHIESLSPPPTGNVEIWEAQKILGPRVGVTGGIEPTRFLHLDLPDLIAYVGNLLERVDPHHYILANSDSCPPGVSVEKFKRVSEIVASASGKRHSCLAETVKK